MSPHRLALAALFFFLTSLPTFAGEKQDPPPGKTVAQLAAQAKESIAVLLYTGRDGKQAGLGTGFVVSADGLIATNLHVIGDGRPITVQMPDGKKYEATEVYASDRKLDLAVVRIPAKGLKPLPLGDAKKLKNGQPLVAIGHPRGLEHSVVAGVLSGRRDIEGVSMLQLAIPIEQGNSGGPVLDMEGRVTGVVTMKALVTANLGFAVPVNALKPLLAKPNPVPMEQWLTIGALDKTEWKTMYGGRWRQRAGRILSDGSGTGFGGRTLCLRQGEMPKMPFELAVSVKLDDEAGAAGLIFGGDGGDKHYGFYPTGGKLRLTRFDGPDVFRWKIVETLPCPAYRPGEWNTLKVRVTKDKLSCYVNDQLVTELDEPDYAGDVIGVAKFRETVAEFKKFQAAPKLATAALKAEVKAAFDKAIAGLPAEGELSEKDLAALLKQPGDGGTLLRDRARAMEKKAAQLRKLAETLHHERCLADLGKLFRAGETDLARAALLVARLDNEELDVDAYRQDIDRLARLVQAKLPKDAKPEQRLQALGTFLFKERGFHGSRADYYTRSNSYLNEVIDDREGLPITLSVLYLELARRLDLNVVGVALPGHFVVRHEPAEGPKQLIDVYDGGKPMSEKEAADKVRGITGRPPEKKDLEAVSKKAIVVRMLHNLIKVAQGEKDAPAMLRYLDAILVIDPDAHEERWARAVFRFQAGRNTGSLVDCDYLIAHAGDDVDLARVRELRMALLRNKD